MTKLADITFQNNVFTLTGELDYSNVMSVYQKSLPHLNNNATTYTFDFSQVKDSNSAGLALIIEWIKAARRQQKKIQFKSLSPELLSIAKVSGLDKVLQSHQ